MNVAVIIWGVQNSGKTSSFRGVVNNYSNKRISQMKRGWQKLFLNTRFTYLNIDSYFFPASPSEIHLNLETHFNKIGIVPDVLFIAEQVNGRNAANTTSFLSNNNYHVLNYNLSNITGLSIWDRFDDSNEQRMLKARADEIIDDIKAFIRNNNIV